MTRNYSMDSLRTLAAMLVILLHVSATYVLKYVEYNNYGVHFWTGNIVNAFTRICVPLFVMISGRYLLGRTESIQTFYKKRASRILLPIIVWSLLYITYRAVFGYVIKKELNVGPILKDAALGFPFYHMWFLFMMIGLYLITPVLNRLLQNVSRKTLWIITILFLAFGFINIAYDNLIGNGPIFLFGCLNYIGYFIIGYLMKDPVNKTSPLLLLFIYILSSLTTAFLSYFTAKSYHNLFFHSYLSPFIIIGSVAIYKLFSQTDIPANAFSRMAHLTLGIYLIHAGILDILIFVLDLLKITYSYNTLLTILLEFLIVAVISIVIAFIISKVKYLRRII